MRPRPISPALAALFRALAFLVLFSSCSLFQGWNIGRHPSSGASLASSSSRIFCLGGSDEAGDPLDSVLSAPFEAGSGIGAWNMVSPLPIGLRNGSAFAAGNLLYYVGGKTAGGLSDAVYYTLIWEDGSLGFGQDFHWERNARSLPQPRADAALALHDGWIYLIGGTTPSGATASIIRARIWQDGQIGQWYSCSESLDRALWGPSAAVSGDRLYIAGGATIAGPKSSFASFGFGEYGSLQDARIEADLPIALQKAGLVDDGDDLLLFGGWDQHGPSAAVFRSSGGIWSVAGSSADAAGPSWAKAGGDLFYLRQEESDKGLTGSLEGLSLLPSPPQVLPGSGLVPNKSLIRAQAEPGLVLRYRTDGLAPGAFDPIWPSIGIKISATDLPSMRVSFAAFDTQGRSSPPVFRSYRLRTTSFFVMVESNLAIRSEGSDLEPRVMEESGGAAPTPVSSLWYRLQVRSAGTFRLTWADADDDASAYSARLKVSVVESDLYTEVPCLDGLPASERSGGLAEPLEMELQPGDYYINVVDKDGLAGRSFGLSAFTVPGL